jgi:Mn2+/Fe2+ NRAMP family transporter
MWIMIVAGLVVVSPALVVILWFIDRPMWILPAAASFVLNILPFVVAVLLLRAQNRKGEEVDAH